MIWIVAADGVVRERLPDETLLVFLSDTHIGGSSGSDIFESAAELTMLLVHLHHHEGPVELVLAGDILDLLRLGDPGRGEDLVAATLARPEYRELFATLRTFAGAEGHRVVYLVGNHDAELWWNPRIRRTLQEAGLVDVVGLSYQASFASLPEQLIYCEHGNQFDPANTITDYANPLDTPVGAHVVTELVRPVGSGVAVTRSIDLRDVSYVFPLAAIPRWVAGRIFYQFLGQVLRWLLAPLVVAYLAYEGLAAVVPALGGSLALRPLVAPAGLRDGLAGGRVRGGVSDQPPDGRACGLRPGARSPRAGIGSSAVPRGRGHPPAPGRRPAAADGRDPLAPGDRGVRVRPYPRPGDVGAGTSRRQADGDRQHRLLASPAAGDRRAPRCPTRLRTRLRPFPYPRPIDPGRVDCGALEPAQAGRATAAVDRARRHRGQDSTPTDGRRRATAGRPERARPQRTQAP
jgi:hypothetical protein